MLRAERSRAEQRCFVLGNAVLTLACAFPLLLPDVTQNYNNPSGLSEVVVGCAGSIEGHTDKWQDPVPGYCACVPHQHHTNTTPATYAPCVCCVLSKLPATDISPAACVCTPACGCMALAACTTATRGATAS